MKSFLRFFMPGVRKLELRILIFIHEPGNMLSVLTGRSNFLISQRSGKPKLSWWDPTPR